MSRFPLSNAPSATRAFAGQATLILLPVVLLAGLAATALRADRRQTEQRALEQAQRFTQTLAVAVVEHLQTSLRHYDQARQDLFPSRPGYRFPPGMRPAWFGSPLQPAAVAPSDQSLEDWILPDPMWSADGSWSRPRQYSLAPHPPAWWNTLDPELRARWETARQLELENAPQAQVVTGYEHCREVVTRHDFDANVLFALRRLAAADLPSPSKSDSLLSFSVNPDIHSPAGLPLSALVLFEILSAWDAHPLSPAVMQRLHESVGVFPSVLTPVLLDLAEQITQRNPATTDPEIQHLRQRWAADERLRQLLPRLTTPDASGIEGQWLAAPQLLVLRSSSLNISENPNDSRPVTNEIVQACLLPLEALTRMAHQAIQANREWLPNYASPQIRLLNQSIFEESTQVGPELARFQVPQIGSVNLPVEVILQLTDPAALYADQRRRERWTAALILVAVVSAAFGVGQAWRALQRQLALNEQKSNFVSAVSHELRAPLASVRLLAEGLADGHITDEPQRRQYGRFLVEEARRLGALVENVLNFARIEQGRAHYEFVPTDARRLVRETMNRFESVARDRNVHLQFLDQTGPQPLEPLWDGVAVQQALANLLDNALKHGPEQTEVSVTLSTPETSSATLRISVSDQGPGIPPEDHTRIFERFYRRGSELRRETRGIGLGLALVKQIIEAHGGRVLVHSLLGQGATFTLEFENVPRDA